MRAVAAVAATHSDVTAGSALSVAAWLSVAAAAGTAATSRRGEEEAGREKHPERGESK